jgi:uncharacterized protein YjdB
VRIAASVEGVAGYSTVTVLPKPPASIELSSSTLSLTVGQESRLQATVRDADGGVLSGAPVDWESNNTAVATVDADGLVHGASAGTAKITATSGNVKDEATVTVSPVPANAVVVSPGSATLFVGATEQLTATVTDANGDPLSGRPVTWSSSSDAVATVSTSGLVKAVAPGTATITATSEGKSGKSTITVKLVPVASVDMDPGELKLQIGKTGTITATPKSADGTALTGRTISWSSHDESIATVDGSGVVTAKAAGATIVEARSEGVTGVALVTVEDVPVSSVTITPALDTLLEGETAQLSANTLDADGNPLTGRTVTWGTSNENIASVSSSGKVTAVAPGSATITATSEGKSGTSTIVVLAPVSKVQIGDIEPSDGQLTVVEGKATQLVALVTDADGNPLLGRKVTWKSADQSIATVDTSGSVAGVKPGTAMITATSEGKSGSANVTVTSAQEGNIVVLPADTTLHLGEGADFKGLVIGSDGVAREDNSLSWSSDNMLVASVNGNGHVQAGVPGSATVTATKSGSTTGKAGTAKVTVVLLGP